MSLSGWSHIWLADDDSGHPDPRKQWPCLLRLPQMAINRANRKAASDAPVRPPPASRAASLRLCQGSRARSQSYWDFCPPLLVAPQPSLGHMGPFLFFSSSKPLKCPGSYALLGGGASRVGEGRKTHTHTHIPLHLTAQQLENCCHLLCLPFAGSGKNVENSGKDISVPRIMLFSPRAW